MSIEVSLLPSHRDWEIVLRSPSTFYISKRWSPGPWKRHFLGCKTGKRLGGDLHTYQRGRKRIYNYKFSKVNALKNNRGLRPRIMKEACLKFSQVEGNFRASCSDLRYWTCTNVNTSDSSGHQNCDTQYINSGKISVLCSPTLLCTFLPFCGISHLNSWSLSHGLTTLVSPENLLELQNLRLHPWFMKQDLGSAVEQDPQVNPVHLKVSEALPGIVCLLLIQPLQTFSNSTGSWLQIYEIANS